MTIFGSPGETWFKTDHANVKRRQDALADKGASIWQMTRVWYGPKVHGPLLNHNEQPTGRPWDLFNAIGPFSRCASSCAALRKSKFHVKESRSYLPRVDCRGWPMNHHQRTFFNE